MPADRSYVDCTLITKNLQFLNNHHETLAKFTAREMLILRKFHNDWIKILDFLLSVNIIACALFHDSPFKIEAHTVPHFKAPIYGIMEY